MPKIHLQQIFVDSTGKRWFRVQIISSILISILVLAMSILLIMIVSRHFPDYLDPARENLSSKKVLMVFDDAPDQKNTTQTLEILNQYKVPAVFLISGYKLNQNSQLLEKIFEEGHEIGNGGFVQSKLGLLAGASNVWGLNTTQILMANELNVYSKLSTKSLDIKLDPKDWPSQTPGQFARHIVEAVNKGQNIILLHQGWGSETTVLALPTILEKLKSEGFTFVTAAERLGTQKNVLMPAIPTNQQYWVKISGLAMAVINGATWFLTVFGLAAAIFGIARIVSIGLAAFYGHYHRHRKIYKKSYPTVAVIVPAFNEAKVIERTVNSLLKTNYPKLQIVVIDDGSSDGTYEVAVKAYKNEPQVLCLAKENSGKADSINEALNHTKAEIVIIIDADTQIKDDAIFHLVQPFQDKKIGAVAGNAKVGNRLNMITKLQALEYITSQNLDRRAFAVLNCIKVVPGAIGAWRLTAIKETGGFTPDTLAEDTDLTIKLLRRKWRIEYAEKAIAYTEAPDTIGLFMKQRFRWMYGTLQAIWKHIDILGKVDYGHLGLLIVFDALIFQIVFPLFAPIMDLYLLGHLIGDGWGVISQKVTVNVFTQPLIYYLIFLTLDYLAALTSFVFEKREDKKLLAWLFLQRFVYRQLLYIISIRSILTALKGGPVGWNKLARKATVQVR